MDSSIIVAVITAAVTLVGVLASNNSTKAVFELKIENLEKKVEKHNSLIERMALLEADSKTKWARIDELREQMEEMRQHEL